MRGPKRSTVARAVASRHGESDNARRPIAQTHAKAEAWERALRNPEFLPFKTPQWDNILPSGRCRTVACRAGERTPWPQFTPPSPTHPAKTAGMSYSGPRLATDANEVTTNSPLGATHGARWRCVGRGLWRFPGPRTSCVWVSPCYANTMLPKNRSFSQTGEHSEGVWMVRT